MVKKYFVCLLAALCITITCTVAGPVSKHGFKAHLLANGCSGKVKSAQSVASCAKEISEAIKSDLLENEEIPRMAVPIPIYQSIGRKQTADGAFMNEETSTPALSWGSSAASEYMNGAMQPKQQRKDMVAELSPETPPSKYADYISMVLVHMFGKCKEMSSDEILIRDTFRFLELRMFVENVITRTRSSFNDIAHTLLYLQRLKKKVPSLNGTSYMAYEWHFLLGLALSNRAYHETSYATKSWSEVSGFKIADINRRLMEVLVHFDFNLNMLMDDPEIYEIYRFKLLLAADSWRAESFGDNDFVAFHRKIGLFTDTIAATPVAPVPNYHCPPLYGHAQACEPACSMTSVAYAPKSERYYAHEPIYTQYDMQHFPYVVQPESYGQAYAPREYEGIEESDGRNWRDNICI